jgi:hypothetical protein
MTRPRVTFLIAVFFLLLISCSQTAPEGIKENKGNNDSKPSTLQDIPFVVYRSSGGDSGIAKLGAWEISSSRLSYGDDLYSFSRGNGTPLYWSGETLVLNQQEATPVKGSDHSYQILLAEGDRVSGGPRYYFKDLTVTGPVDEEKPVYDIQYEDSHYKLSLSELPAFADRRSYLANAALTEGGSGFRLVFTAAPKVFKPGEGWLIVVEYQRSTSRFTATEFPAAELPFGDMIVNPRNSLLDGDRLYVWRSRDYGYFDLQKQTFVQQVGIYKDIQNFMPDRKPNPNVEPQIIPVGHVGKLLLLYDPTVYFDEKTNGAVVYAYDGETPAGKLLLKGDKLYVYDRDNKQVGEPQNFGFKYTGGELFTFPK